MNKPIRIILLVFIAVLTVVTLFGAPAQNPSLTPNNLEYAWLRWDGPDNTHIITPSGSVEMLGVKLKTLKKPDRADQRAFYLTAVINSLTKDGWEVVDFKDADVLLKRAIK